MSFGQRISTTPWPNPCSDGPTGARENPSRRRRRCHAQPCPWHPSGLLGADALRAIAAGRLEEAVWSDIAINTLKELHFGTLPDLIGELPGAGRGVVMTMGKGGVGRTTVAAAVAVALADRGFPVHLSTTDPAAHLAAAVHGTLPNLQVSKIDPRAEIAAYTAEASDGDRSRRTLTNTVGRMLEEDLRSPARKRSPSFAPSRPPLMHGEDGFVVLDTAPTGHTILLLDAALAYHREISHQASQLPTAFELLPRLPRNASYTRVLIVTLPEATPVHEAAQLQRDLRRAGIEPFGWVINQSLSTLDVHDPVLASRKRHEAIFLCEVAKQHAWRVYPPGKWSRPSASKRCTFG